MKTYFIETMEEANRYGEIKFTWSDGQVTKVCIQHIGQPAVFFEELLRDNGYRKDGEKQSNWDDNSIQFPRLISEMNAIVDWDGDNWNDLLGSMDLTEVELNDLFDRAENRWEKIKEMFAPYVDPSDASSNIMGGDTGVDADDPNHFIIPEEEE